jgi:hypothetical protein
MYFKQLTIIQKCFVLLKLKTIIHQLQITMSNPLIKITNIKRDFGPW